MFDFRLGKVENVMQTIAFLANLLNFAYMRITRSINLCITLLLRESLAVSGAPARPRGKVGI